MSTEIVWRNFRFEVPADWEMLQFGKKLQSGKCRFADRYHQRLEWNWVSGKGQPDLSETIQRHVAENSDSTKASVGKWIGIESGSASRYLRYFKDADCVVEFIFTWTEERDEALLKRLLGSVRLEQDRWKAFGMELRTSSTLSECEVRPAMARMKFIEAGEEFQRLGMVSEWLAAPVHDWLRLKVPPKLRVTGTTKSQTQGHEIAELEAAGYSEPFHRALRRKTIFKAAAWLCPADGRLYFHSRTSPQPSGSISCCPAYTHV